MSSKRRRLEQLAAELSDGAGSDWEQLADEEPELAAEIRKMQGLSRLARAFRDAAGEAPDDGTEPGLELLRWGHLHILKLLGEGSFGEVYRAYDPVLDRDVALKLRRDSESSLVESRAFIQEARRLAQVRHHHVLAVHGADINDGRAGLWTDLLDGETLRERIEREGPTGVDGFFASALAIGEATSAVHDRGLVHCDLKPGNIMLEPDGRIVVMDFGAGGFIQDFERVGFGTSGTPLVMAPEQFKGQAPNPATDVYSLGVVMFFLLTGQYPVTGADFEELKRAHAAGRRRSLSSLRGGLPRAIRRLVDQCLAADPASRPSVGQLVRSLRWIAEAPRRRARRLAIAAIMVALSGGLIATSYGFYQARKSELAAIRSREQALQVNAFVHQMLGSASALKEGREARVADVLDSAVLNAAARLGDQPESLAAIRYTLGTTYRSLGLYEQALDLLEKSWEARRSILGQNNADTLASGTAMAHTLTVMERTDESLPLLADISARADEHLGRHHAVAVRAAIRHGTALVAARRMEAAEQKLQEVLGRAELSGEQRSLAYLALADLYLQVSRFSEVERVGLQALEWYRAHRGESNFNTISTLNHLAVAYARQGKAADAENIYRELVSLTTTLMGENSTMGVKMQVNLGNTLYDQGRYAESLEVFRPALDAARQLSSNRPRSISVAAMGIANAQKGLGQFDLAEAGYRARIEADREALGPLDEQTLIAQYNLTELLRETGRYGEAVETARANVAAMRERFGPSHFYSLEATDNLALALRGDGSVNEAVELLESNLGLKLEAFGPGHPLVLKTRAELVRSLDAAGARERALDQARSLLETSTRVLGPEHPQTVAAEEMIEGLKDGR